VSALGDRIRETRLARGLTQPETATQIGVSLRAVQDWEQGRRDPERGPAMIRGAIERWLRK